MYNFDFRCLRALHTGMYTRKVLNIFVVYVRMRLEKRVVKVSWIQVSTAYMQVQKH
jgi:hypothetical protein